MNRSSRDHRILWAFVDPMPSDEEAAACRVVTPRLDYMLQIKDTLRNDVVCERLSGMREGHQILREKIRSLHCLPSARTVLELSENLLSLGISVVRERADVSEEFTGNEPRSAHEQQATGIIVNSSL